MEKRSISTLAGTEERSSSLKESGGKNISILDVTNPAQIHGVARANISAAGPFDFVQSLNDRAILISYRDQTGLAVLDFKKFDRTIVTQISSGAQAIPTQTIDDA